ncbi:MAG: C-GCAxxG-C-C family protein [Bacteroidetes bacterium]|nr:C-GCAxxG-C-C family protein [Bacteroidota bacterium]
MNKKLTRKDFLTNTTKYAIGAAAGVAGLNMLSGGKAFAKTNSAWPFPYQNIDPEEARVKAHWLYYNEMDCCSGVFGVFTDLLKEKIGDPWTNMPMEVMLYGRGGGAGWGSTCGVINGGAAVISLVVNKADSGKLINELWGWYTTENLPTEAANTATYLDTRYTDVLPQNIAGSPLCHASVSQWCMVAGKKVGDVERKERCARIAGDAAAKTAEILNAYFASTFTGTFAVPAANSACMPCHGAAMFNNVMTNMECASCHPDAHPNSPSAVDEIGGVPSDFTLEQNYPNPFNPTTNIRFAIPQQGKVRLEVYDIQGQLVNSLIDSEVMNAGTYKADWNGKDNLGNRVSSGVYFARLTTANFMKTIKMNLVK